MQTRATRLARRRRDGYAPAVNGQHPHIARRGGGDNRYFTSLSELIRFYNTRDLGDWPAAEVPRNVSGELGDLRVSEPEIDAIVAFLNTLTDQQ